MSGFNAGYDAMTDGNDGSVRRAGKAFSPNAAEDSLVALNESDHFAIITRESYTDRRYADSPHEPGDTVWFYKYTPYASRESWITAIENNTANKVKFVAIEATPAKVETRVIVSVNGKATT